LDPVAFERYRYVIPVIEIDHGPTFELKISEHRLRAAFDELTREQDVSAVPNDPVVGDPSS
jgi:hypothetical protein